MAITSLAFMFDDVPEPVWKMSTGNWSSHCPSATSSAAARMASPTVLSTASTSLRRAFTAAASPLISARARIRRRSMGRWEIGKFSTARWVCAAHLASAGTFTSPMESCSIRNGSLAIDMSVMGSGLPVVVPSTTRGRRADLAPSGSSGEAAPNVGADG